LLRLLELLEAVLAVERVEKMVEEEEEEEGFEDETEDFVSEIFRNLASVDILSDDWISVCRDHTKIADNFRGGCREPKALTLLPDINSNKSS
jgi:hypothetical protein